MKKIFDVYFKYEKPLKILIVSLGFTVVLATLSFDRFEAILYDFRISKSVFLKRDPNLLLVTLDQRTTEALDEFSPLSLDWHTNFIHALEILEPKAVGYLVDFNRVSQVNSDASFWQLWGPRFVEEVEKLQKKGIPFLLGTPYDVTGEVLPPYPLSALPHSISVIHNDGNVFAEDKVTRRALIEMNQKPSFHMEMVRLITPQAHSVHPRGTFALPEINGKNFFFRYFGDPATHPYPTVSFLDVLQGKLNAGAFRGKTVLVGTVSKDDFSDYVYTPYSRTPFTSPKIQVHASILDSILQNRGVVLAPGILTVFLTLVTTAVVLFWVMTYSPFVGFFYMIALAFGFLVVSQIFFQAGGIWIQESKPLISIFLTYYLAVPFRLVLEHKTRWEYQRQNELLTQVEELKTNFLSLVTHDLKTPIARIQGLAEVLMKKGADRLLEKDLETLRSIVGSTEELNHFISTILELSKIESRRLKIQIESKDINALIERAVDNFQAPARARGIQIVKNLEPLFPIRIDVRLISKVINTLIDNALKYSPNGTQITIESREVGEWIEISVRDQGIGLSTEELEKLFTRFYRAKNDRTTQISGTGLGLYLTKYFVEAHRGQVEVESEKNKGSVFRIRLPLTASTVTAGVLSLEKKENRHV